MKRILGKPNETNSKLISLIQRVKINNFYLRNRKDFRDQILSSIDPQDDVLDIGKAMRDRHQKIISKSLETLAVRADKHCENALKVAKFLENHPEVNFVKYPFLKSHPQYEVAKKQMRLGGNIVAFEIKGGVEAGRRFLDRIKLCSLSANLGDSRTIVTHPSSTTHSKLSTEDRLEVGITDGLVRCSVGLEFVDDVIEDLNQALNN